MCGASITAAVPGAEQSAHEITQAMQMLAVQS